MPQVDHCRRWLPPISHEDACEHAADLSRELAGILRYRGLDTIVGLLERASIEAEKLVKASAAANASTIQR